MHQNINKHRGHVSSFIVETIHKPMLSSWLTTNRDYPVAERAQMGQCKTCPASRKWVGLTTVALTSKW